MPSRPQFSLRLLLFVILMVCLAAATVSPADYPAPGTLAFRGRTVPETMSLAAHVQGALRTAMCIALPAMVIAGALQPRRHVQTFCCGALFPALAGSTIVLLRCYFWLEGMHKYVSAYGSRGILMTLDFLWKSLPQLRYEVAIAWALAVGCGVVALLIEWAFGLGRRENREGNCVTRPRDVGRFVLLAAATVSLAAFDIAKTPSWFYAVSYREPLFIALSMTVQGLLVTGAVRLRGFAQSFCVGAALASCLAWAIICQGLLVHAVNRGNPFGLSWHVH